MVSTPHADSARVATRPQRPRLLRPKSFGIRPARTAQAVRRLLSNPAERTGHHGLSKDAAESGGLHGHRAPFGEARPAGPEARSLGARHPLPPHRPRRRDPGHARSSRAARPRDDALARRSVGRHRRAPALRAPGAGRGRRAGRGGQPGDPGTGRQRGALRDPDPRGRAAATQHAPPGVQRPEAGRGGAERQVGAAVSGRPLPRQLRDRLRPPAAAPPGRVVPRDRRDVRGADRARAHLRLPARGGDAAPQRPGPGRQPGERGGHRRDRRAEQQRCASRTSSCATRSWTRSATWPCSAIPWSGHLEAEKAGHALHASLARKLLATPGGVDAGARSRRCPSFEVPRAPGLAVEPA